MWACPSSFSTDWAATSTSRSNTTWPSPAFDRLERVCWFEPVLEAAKWKETIQLDRIAQLEARVKELELRK